uniref:Vpu n=1 Tax=Simian immunodeficiency virus TaxID=11723 RepID=A0A075E7K2_SIV|nr:Vpu [Simian immunodeficiency virus]
MNVWYLAAAVVTGIYFIVAIVALWLIWDKYVKKQPTMVSVIRLLEEGDSGYEEVFEDAMDQDNINQPLVDNPHGFDNPAFEQ